MYIVMNTDKEKYFNHHAFDVFCFGICCVNVNLHEAYMYHVRLAKLRNDATLHEFSYILRNLLYILVIACFQNRKSYDVLIVK